MPGAEEAEETHGYKVHTRELNILSGYSKLNFKELLELEIDEYRLLLRDAYISKLDESEAGREYLETAWILEQSSPDRKTLKDMFGKE